MFLSRVFRDTRDTSAGSLPARPAGAHENHRRVHRNSTACTHAFLMPLMRVSLCNDLSCYPPENRYERRSTRRRHRSTTLAARMNASTCRAVDCITKSINFLIFDRAYALRREGKERSRGREKRVGPALIVRRSSYDYFIFPFLSLTFRSWIVPGCFRRVSTLIWKIYFEKMSTLIWGESYLYSNLSHLWKNLRYTWYMWYKKHSSDITIIL